MNNYSWCISVVLAWCGLFIVIPRSRAASQEQEAPSLRALGQEFASLTAIASFLRQEIGPFAQKLQTVQDPQERQQMSTELQRAVQDVHRAEVQLGELSAIIKQASDQDAARATGDRFFWRRIRAYLRALERLRVAIAREQDQQQKQALKIKQDQLQAEMETLLHRRFTAPVRPPRAAQLERLSVMIPAEIGSSDESSQGDSSGEE